MILLLCKILASAVPGPPPLDLIVYALGSVLGISVCAQSRYLEAEI